MAGFACTILHRAIHDVTYTLSLLQSSSRSSVCSVFQSHKKGLIALLDTRAPQATLLPTEYYGPNIVNTVRWAVNTANGDAAPVATPPVRPLATAYGPAPHLLLATTWGTAVRVFDVRNTARPYASLEGHNIEGHSGGNWLKAEFTWGARQSFVLLFASQRTPARTRKVTTVSSCRTPVRCRTCSCAL